MRFKFYGVCSMLNLNPFFGFFCSLSQPQTANLRICMMSSKVCQKHSAEDQASRRIIMRYWTRLQLVGPWEGDPRYETSQLDYNTDLVLACLRDWAQLAMGWWQAEMKVGAKGRQGKAIEDMRAELKIKWVSSVGIRSIMDQLFRIPLRRHHFVRSSLFPFLFLVSYVQRRGERLHLLSQPSIVIFRLGDRDSNWRVATAIPSCLWPTKRL